MPEIYNEDLLESLKALQVKVNLAINSLGGYAEFRSDMTSAAKTTRVNDIKTKCSDAGVTTTDWLGNDTP